ncbi:hypothetical protein [Aureimonas populi]|uniref:Uncharacterized protein n=1 Tax=Aureimonas populi TaxID=1701758 RepID=A0ABW5CPZ4_9HYPH|nr:hypothetical protein [Aureimonas populi]
MIEPRPLTADAFRPCGHVARSVFASAMWRQDEGGSDTSFPVLEQPLAVADAIA